MIRMVSVANIQYIGLYSYRFILHACMSVLKYACTCTHAYVYGNLNIICMLHRLNAAMYTPNAIHEHI